MNALQLSIVIPCYNEEDCIRVLHARTSAAARSEVGESYELILVNDGSSDATWNIMTELASEDPRLIAINLSRNHGHQLALTAGLDLSCGAQILIIDADLQDPPELLSEMRAQMKRDQADVVYAVRGTRKGESFFKKSTASGFYRLLDRLTDTKIPMDTGDFRLMSRRALDAFLVMPEQARFIRGMVAWVGFRQVPFVYEREERFAGSTHYPLGKMIRLAFDAVTGFSIAPLRFASHLGLWLTAASILLIIYIIVTWLSGYTVQGWASTIVIVVFLGAAQMFVLGMIGEYLGRLYLEVKNRPLYLIADVVGEARKRGNLGYNAQAEVTTEDQTAETGSTITANESPTGNGTRPIA
jgi:polyisoprenyl-phosphate glycosyltransferase